MKIISDIKDNLKKAKFNSVEISGAFGDIGTFIPLLLAMSQSNGLDFASGLFFAGVASVLTGMFFAIPMAIQPMKAIAAVAITQGLGAGEIIAAGLIVSVIVFIIGVLGLVDYAIKIVPKNVIRGIQLALGLSLGIKGLQMLTALPVFLGHDSIAIASCALFFILLGHYFSRIPVALILFVVGLLLVFFFSDGFVAPKLSLWFPTFHTLKIDDFIRSFAPASLPQVPLTLLNSVIAVCALSADLFPREKISAKKVAISVGLMNICCAWFGAMPMCHGSGGLAGQHQFGARTNGSILFLGLLKMVLALVFGPTLISLCLFYPKSILGILLFFSGLSLASACRDQSSHSDILIVLLIAIFSLALNNIALGFFFGIVLAKGIEAGVLKFS